MARVVLVGVGIALLLSSLSGCGGGKSSIEGNVTYEGQPIQHGNISFQPSDGKGPSAGVPITNGRYSIASIEPGPKTVIVQAEKNTSGPVSSAEMEAKSKEQAGKAPESNILVPPDAQGNNAKFDVVAGKQTKDFALLKPADSAK